MIGGALSQMAGSLLMGTASIGIGIDNLIKGNKKEKEAEKMFNQGLQMQQQFLGRLENLYGNTIENYAKYVENLNGSSFAAPYVQELRLQSQQMLEQQQKAIQQSGLAGSGYAVESQKQTQQQLAENTANAVWQGEQQAKQLQGQQANMGIQMIGNQTNAIAGALQNRSSQLSQRAYNLQDAGQVGILQGMEAYASAASTGLNSNKQVTLNPFQRGQERQ